MTFFEIPVAPNTPWQTFTITLSGVVYTLTLAFNVRMNEWSLDIGDINGNPILTGISILIQVNFLAQYRHLALPPGIIYALDNTGNQQQPGLNSFGVTHTLWYQDPTT